MDMKLLDKIKDRWLTWRTGKTREVRERDEWIRTNINHRADTIKGIFVNFKYVIEVDFWKFCTDGGMGCLVPVSDARQYLWPERPLGENCVWTIERVCWDQWVGEWRINEIAGEDRVFIATNNKKDAIMIALRWA